MTGMPHGHSKTRCLNVVKQMFVKINLMRAKIAELVKDSRENQGNTSGATKV